MSTRHETDHMVSWCHFITNTFARGPKIGSNALEKKKRSCPFSSATARGKKPKKSFNSDWAEKLGESKKGS